MKKILTSIIFLSLSINLVAQILPKVGWVYEDIEDYDIRSKIALRPFVTYGGGNNVAYNIQAVDTASNEEHTYRFVNYYGGLGGGITALYLVENARLGATVEYCSAKLQDGLSVFQEIPLDGVTPYKYKSIRYSLHFEINKAINNTIWGIGAGFEVGSFIPISYPGNKSKIPLYLAGQIPFYMRITNNINVYVIACYEYQLMNNYFEGTYGYTGNSNEATIVPNYYKVKMPYINAKLGIEFTLSRDLFHKIY